MIAVVDSGAQPFLRALGDVIAEAMAPDSASEGAAIALPAAEPRREVEGASAVLALDPESMARARDARVAVRLAWVGWLDPGWEEVLADVRRVFVAHPALVDSIVAMGVPRARVEAASWIAMPPRDRAAARAELGLAADAPVLIVPTQVIGDDLTALLFQLALVRDSVRILFDVGEDEEAARVLRQRVVFPAHMFAEGETAALAWAAADRAVARLSGPELARALAHGVKPVLAPARPGDLLAARALAGEGLATLIASDAMLAVAIDEACTPRAIERARAAISALELGQGGARIAARVEQVVREPDVRPLAAGLPRGLEPIGPRASSPVPPGPTAGPSVEDVIEKELEALRARLRSPS